MRAPGLWCSRQSWVAALRRRPHGRGLAAAFASRTREEWGAVFSGTDACVAPVLSLTEAAADPHLAARGSLLERDGVLQPAAAARFGGDRVVPGRPPGPGEHTRNVLEAAGLDAERLIADGTAG